MENDNLMIGKTITSVELKDDAREDKIVLIFSDGSSCVIASNASNFMYSLFIESAILA